MRRPADQWIAIAVPTIVSDELFEAAQQVSYDNSQWSPRRAEPQHWLLRGLVQCGHCGGERVVSKDDATDAGTVTATTTAGTTTPSKQAASTGAALSATFAPTSWMPSCLNRSAPRCYVRTCCSTARRQCQPTLRTGDDELLAAQLARFDRKLESAAAERRRLADLYQAGFLEREELQRRGKEVEVRRRTLEAQRQALTAQRQELAQQNRLRERVEGFADKVKATIDHLDFDQRQKLLRLVIDNVRVQGWQIEIKLRIPLESPPEPPGTGLSIKDRLRSLHGVPRQKLSTERSCPPSCKGQRFRVTILTLLSSRLGEFDLATDGGI